MEMVGYLYFVISIRLMTNEPLCSLLNNVAFHCWYNHGAETNNSSL